MLWVMHVSCMRICRYTTGLIVHLHWRFLGVGTRPKSGLGKETHVPQQASVRA